ncbi:MAG TPA: hypothetical protein VF631_01610 [Allosphingosinicella sp.]|jgi:hypothetical protein|uniref:beta strand repeat-containing protein n=1 Tax=Allosphingosinicella sp. TaxID=2823234 RepID=UPI002F281241
MTELAHIAVRRTGFRNRRETLLVSAAVGMALALMPATDEAHAQNGAGAFRGTPSFDPTKVDIVRSTNTDSITVKVPSTTINWTVDDLNFLPQGARAFFQNDPNLPNFVVLNRIVPTNANSPIQFNGAVVSRLQDSTGSFRSGGSVAFYSPGGIFVGPTATFDVGSLLLTTLDPLTDGSGNFVNPQTGNLSLRGAAGSTAAVITAPGSQINAVAEGSTVAMVAAQVIHQGAVRVNGSAAYIAAESVDVVVNNGLFDINVLTGTPVANAVQHIGSTGGPASTGAGDNQIIYMVAVPKNQAITLTLQGSAGFDPATSVTVENGEIILSAGHNVSGRTIATNPVNVTDPTTGQRILANAVVNGGTYSSDLRARATGDAAVRTTLGNDTTFVQDVSLFGSQRAFIAAESGRTINVFGNALVSNLRGDAPGSTQGSGSVANFGHESTIQATGANSLVDIRGSATIDASTRGTNSANATGGRAEIFAVTGRVEVDGAVSINAGGFAGATFQGQDGPDGTGGRAAVQASGGGTIALGSTANVSSNGLGGVRQGGSDNASGTGTGGTAVVEAFNSGSAVTIAGAANVEAEGRGGPSFTPGNGGRGVGGTATIAASSSGAVNVGTGSSVGASGSGGTMSQGGGTSGGDGQGGVAQVFAVSNGTVTSTGNLSITAAGIGGSGVFDNGGFGGAGTGGLAQMFAVDGRVNFGNATITASGTGGFGVIAGEGRGGGFDTPSTPNSTTGAFVSARRGQVVGTGLTISAVGTGGAGGAGPGGIGRGGDAFVTAFNGSVPGDNVAQDGPSLVDIDNVTVRAQGNGGNGAPGEAGGAAFGGEAGITAQAINGTVDVVSAVITAGALGGRGGAGTSSTSGPGGAGGAGGAAVGGFVTVGQVSGATDTPNAAKAGAARFGGISASANASGGAGGDGGNGTTAGAGGLGGNAIGGAVALLARGATLTVSNGASLIAFGNGGTGGLGGDVRAAGGRGAGGSVGAYFTPFFDTVANAVTTAGATVTIGSLNLDTRGLRSVSVGATATTQFDQAGDVQLDLIGSTANIGQATMNVSGATARNAVALGFDPQTLRVSPTNDPNYVRASNGALTFTTANGGAGTLDANLVGDLEFAAVGTGTIRAATQIDARVSGLLSFTHANAPANAVAVAAPNMFFTSSRIEVGGLVGDADTNFISLFADEQLDFPAVFGGDVEEAGYTLTRAEAARLQADDISIQVDRIFDDPTQTEVLIRDLTLQGTATGDGTGSIDLFADGIVRIEGKVDFVNAAATDSLAIGSDTRLELITPTGGIRMTAPDGSLSGLLSLDSSRIVVADSTLAAQLAADPNFAGRNEALRTNNGPVNPAGYLEAGGIIIETDGEAGSEGVYIQNTGTATEFAGLTVGAAGLFIDSENVGPIDLVGFGRRANGDGTFTTGDAFFAQVNFGTATGDPEEQPTTYTAASEFNGCNVNNGCASAPPPPPPVGNGAFAGTPAFDETRVTIARGDALDTITVKAPTAIINWTPTDNQGSGPINFLPQGHTGIFQNDTSITNFAVLNRIIPADASRRVDFNGRVVSQLRDASGNVTGPGGTVAFYAPGGIFVSSTAVFDVGRLLLTSLDPLTDDSGSFVGANGLIRLRGASGSTVPIITAAGSRINALSEGSWVALAGPRLEIGGAVRVNGSVDYVAAEQVDLTPGLSVGVLAGTSVSAPLVHTGSTGGPGSSSFADNHRITMVAAPKDQPITATVSGTVGFDAPTGTGARDDAIVLSAGYNVGSAFMAMSGEPAQSPIPLFGSQPVVATAANFLIPGGNFTSNVTGRATTDFLAASDTATPDFSGDVRIQGGSRAHIASRVAGETLTIGGNAFVIANAFSQASNSAGESQTGGQALLYAQNGGTLAIAGSATAAADARASGSAAAPAISTAGQAVIFARGGTVTIGGAATVSATANPTFGGGADVVGPTAIGGQAGLDASESGTLAIAGAATVEANGFGGFNTGSGNGGVASDGTGGRALISTNAGGQLSIGGGATVRAQGVGGGVNGAAQGGVGTGGNAFILTTAAGQASRAQSITITGPVVTDASGRGGGQISTQPGAGGAGVGGRTVLFAPIGTLTVNGSVSAVATGTGGTGTDGGRGTGGQVEVTALGGGVIGFGAATLNASGFGGIASDNAGSGAAQGGNVVVATRGTAGGQINGGDVIIFADGIAQAASGGSSDSEARAGRGQVDADTGSVTFRTLEISSDGISNGSGAAFGGTAQVLANGGAISITGPGLNTLSALNLTAIGTVNVNRSGVDGGDGTGGLTTVVAQNGGTVDAQRIFLNSNGRGGNNTGGGDGIAGKGTGGTARVLALAGSTVRTAASVATDVSTGSLLAGVSGNGGTNVSGQRGGDGQGGTVVIGANGGTLFVGQNISTNAGASGGSFVATAPVVTTGGNATGGSETVFAQGGGTLTVGSTIGISAAAQGGAGFGAGNGGSATGGSSTVAANGGTVRIRGDQAQADLVAGSFVRANATGGASSGGQAATGAGGNATAGRAQLVAINGGTIEAAPNVTNTSIGTFTVSAVGTGGAGNTGGAGGAGRGGLALASATGGNSTLRSVAVDASGVGGAGATGGSGQGGANTGEVLNPNGGALIAARDGRLVAASATATSNGTGGAGSTGAGGSGTGGQAGATAFNAANATTANASVIDIDTVTVSALGQGGSSGGGAAGAFGRGGETFLVAEGISGALAVDTADLRSSGTGGQGGAGAARTDAAGGTGGAGGAGIGGIVSVGQISGAQGGTAPRNGQAQIGALTAASNGTGGRGGAGGTGTTGGAGGAGGNGLGGSVTLFARGARLNVTSAQLTANGTGALGGAGGGSAATGATGRGGGGLAFADFGPFAGTSDPANVTVGSLTLTANGSRVSGDNATASDLYGETRVNLSGGPASIGTLSMTATGGAGPRTLAALGVTSAPVGDSAGASSIRADRGTLTLGDTNANVSGNLNFAAVGSGSIRSTGTITATSGGTVALSHETPGTDSVTLSAPRINLTSANIDIGQGAFLGVNGTTTGVNLTAVPNGRQVVIGGTEEGQGYTLTQAEIGRIRSAALNFATAAAGSDPNRGADLLIRALTLNGSAANGFSTVTFTTPGRVRVEGAVAVNGAAATDRVAITGTERLEVITPTGSITMRDASNQLGGILQLMSDNIAVTDSALANQLAANPNFEGRDAALRTNNGAATPAGFIQAGGVQLLSGGRIFVQNTGTATEFAGLTVGGGGLLIGRMTPTQNPGGGTGGGTGTPTTGFSFTGTLQTANEVLFFDFTVSGQSNVTLRSYSYAGGTNARGQSIPAGGFDPILALFDAAGALVGQNDDGGSNVPSDPTTGLNFDVFLQRSLAPGNYRVAVSVFPNFAVGPNLSNGFQGATTLNGRSANFAFDVLGATSATGPGQSQPQTPVTVVAFGRQQNADGTFTGGAALFERLGFNSADASANFTSGSSFNNLAIGQAVPVPPPPPTPPSAPPPVSGSEVILGPITGATSAAAAQDDGDGDGGPGSGFGAGFIGIVDTGQIANESLIEDPVASGGDSTLWTDGEDDDACDTPGGIRSAGTPCSATGGAPVSEPEGN